MTRTVPSFAEEGLKRFLHGMDRRITDLERGGEWRFDTEFEPAGGSSSTRNAAQLLVMSATTDSIASGGDFVVFDSIAAQHGFAGVSGAAGAWEHPLSGVYVLTYEHAWDTYTGGGSIRLEVDGTLIPEGVLADGTSGTGGSETIMYRAEAGHVGKIHVVQTSGSAQTCDAVVRVAIPDPDPSTAQVSSGFPAFIANAVPTRSASTGETFVDETVSVYWDSSGTVYVSGDGASATDIYVDDLLMVNVTHEDGSTAYFETGLTNPSGGPFSLNGYMEAGTNTIRIRCKDTGGSLVGSSDLWLVKV